MVPMASEPDDATPEDPRERTWPELEPENETAAERAARREREARAYFAKRGMEAWPPPWDSFVAFCARSGFPVSGRRAAEWDGFRTMAWEEEQPFMIEWHKNMQEFDDRMQDWLAHHDMSVTDLLHRPPPATTPETAVTDDPATPVQEPYWKDAVDGELDWRLDSLTRGLRRLPVTW